MISRTTGMYAAPELFISQVDVKRQQDSEVCPTIERQSADSRSES